MPSRGFYAPVIAIFNKQKKNGKKMTITGDGEQRRDFIYVKDIVAALMNSLEPKANRAIGKVLNLGTGKNYSINEIAKLLGGDFIYIAAREGDARETLAAIEATKDLLGWYPKMALERWIETLNDNN